MTRPPLTEEEIAERWAAARGAHAALFQGLYLFGSAPGEARVWDRVPEREKQDMFDLVSNLLDKAADLKDQTP